MSHAPNISSPTSLDKDIWNFVFGVVANPSPRGLDMAIELLQRYIDYLDELIVEGIPAFQPTSVTVKADGTTIKFENIEAVANWLTEANHG
jgi:hypothetical protein